MTTGVSPKDPNKYVGPYYYISSVVNRKREPTGADYRQPETGKTYPISSFWIIGTNPTNGTEGDMWYLSKIVSNVAYWVKLSSGGTGVGLQNIIVDAFTFPGTNPVVPDAGSTITITGNQVATGVIGANVIRSDSLAPNSFVIEIQRSTTNASSSLMLNGVSHYNSTQFVVDANGFVSLVGQGAPMQSTRVDATSGSGTNPVLPDVNGETRVQGALVAAGTNPIRSVSTLANQYQIQLQTSQALAAADSTKVGLSNYSSNDFNVDANGFVTSKGNSVMTGVINIGFSYASGSGTFTVHGQNGTALSASNPGYVTLQDSAAFGQLITIPVTSNQDFIDDNGASQIIGNLFGLTTAIAVTVDIPFFLYAVLNDARNAIQFMISRFPNATTSPVAAKIGMPSSAVADTQGSFFSFDNITAADWEGNPCLSIGSFRMRMSASDDWTVQTLAARDGIGHFQEGIQFSFPRGQFGAASGKVYKNNGGTAPNDADGGYTYYMDSDNNRIFYQLAFPAIDTAGVGAVNLQLALPFQRLEGATSGSGFHSFGGAYSFIAAEVLPTTNTVQFPQVNSATSGIVLNSDIILNEAISLNGTMAINFS